MKVLIFVGFLAVATCSPLVLGVTAPLQFRFSQPITKDHTLVPGAGDTSLQAWISPSSPVTAICDQPVNEYITFWSKNELSTRPICLFLYMLRSYVLPDRTFASIPGVSVEARGIGDVWSIEKVMGGGAFENMVNYFKQRGYVVGVNLTGFPYDFRKGHSENDYQVEQLRHLVEKTYKTNEKKVTLISHSMGGTLCLKLLHSMSNDWKDKHVDKFISLAGVYGGSVLSPLIITTHSNLVYSGYLSFKNSSQTTTIQSITQNLIYTLCRILSRSFSAVYWLFPNQHVFPEDHIIVKTPSRNYTSSEMINLFLDLSDVKGASIYNDQKTDLAPPGVEVYCIYSTGLPTVESIEYDTIESFPKYPTNLLNGEGDGIVNRVSLEYCRHWRGHNRKRVHVKHIPNVHHYETLANKLMIDCVGSIVSKKKNSCY